MRTQRIEAKELFQVYMVTRQEMECEFGILVLKPVISLFAVKHS